VRLACVRHAASVDSEPGSNSRLKPDCLPARRRSRQAGRVRILADRDTLPCEIDRAKPDRTSRLARSTCLSKILQGFPPERGPWDRGSDSRQSVLELDAPARNFCAFSALRAFLREPFKNIELQPSGQAHIHAFARAISQTSTGCSRRDSPESAAADSQEKILPGPAMVVVLCGIPDRGPEHCAHSTQRTCFPLPSMGRPNGHREAPLLIQTS
jgi:hypothetical protein